MKYALENPDGPAVFPGTNAPLTPAVNPITNQPWANITQFFQWQFQYLMGSQIGLGDYWVAMHYMATQDRWWPTRLNLEYIAFSVWTNCPYLPYDYDDHYREINVPLLGFVSERYGSPRFGNITRGIASPDVTGIFLPKYGHLDVFIGVYSARDVSQPTLDWMLNRYKAPAATAFCNVTILAGQTWYFFAHSNGGMGSHTYQWYEGTTLLAGQASMVLPVTKSTRGTYTFYCKITDSEGTTTNSNSITLTVI